MITKKIYFIVICLFILGCKENKKAEIPKPITTSKIEDCKVCAKKREILEKVATLFIEKNKEYILKVRNYKSERDKACKRPLIVSITEMDDLKGVKKYAIFFYDERITEKYLPTCLIEKNGIYIAMYFKNQSPLNKESIPDLLFEECNVYSVDEGSWRVLICKNSFKFIVINTYPIPDEAIKQIQEFSCEKGQTDLNNIKVEEAIVDVKILEEMRRR